MLLKTHFKFSDGDQIWRVFPFGNNLLLETRDTEKMIASFHCLDFITKKYFFSNLHFEEKFWIGIETAKNDFVIFHNYQKPDMPMHKGFFLFDIKTQKTIWKKPDLVFNFLHENIIYAFNQGFEGKKFYTLDIFSGNILEEFREDEYQKINDAKLLAVESEDYSDYHFPQKTSLKNLNEGDFIEIYFNKNTFDDILETISFENILLVGYHETRSNGGYKHSLAIFDNRGKILFTETIDKNIAKIALDTFFILKNKLFILKEKKILQVYSINPEAK